MERLSALIAGVRRRWFAAAALRATGVAMAAAAAPLLAGLALYWLFSPAGGPLLALAGSVTLLALAAAAAAVLRMERRPDDLRVARFIQERVEARPGASSMDDCVVSAVQAAAQPAGDAALLAPLVVQAAVAQLKTVEAGDVVPGAVIRRAALAAAGGALALAAALVLGTPALLHSVETARVRFFPASIVLSVLPGDVRVVAGRPLTIRARLHAGGDDLGRITPSLVVSAGDAERTVPMVRTGDGFTFDFESVDRSFAYKVVAGAATSAGYSVTALFAPRVERIDLDYRYPSFSGLAPRSEEDGGDIYAPAGTRVRVRIHADKPVVSGRLALSASAPPLRAASDRVLEADLVVARDDAYRISLVDRDGLGADDDSEYFIRVMEDRPPDVRILRPSGDQGITPLQEVAIEARAEDDYGVAALDLVYSVAGGPERKVRFARVSGTATDRTGAHLLAAEELRVSPGDVIAYHAVARDVGRGRPSTEVKSDLFFLEVKPFTEEFEAAQSQASGGASGDPQIDALIQAQKDIISATWNIERRSIGGRSADDVKAVARAQAELKARVERVMSGRRGGRGDRLPQRIAPQAQPRPTSSADPVAAAVEAMTRAIEQLASERTRDAIPHEMAALNGLLQAQAEVRRRQVAQQARGGGGSGNRQSQDLSALFDKELQRQQQTNYEQRSQVEERQDQQQGTDQDLLDRVRDLARRQDELNRQQQEAARQQAEERKRQLERLAREQQELRQQVEELSKQMDQRSQAGRQPQGQQGQPQQGQQSQGQQSQGQGQGGAGARAAMDQMRRAADELRRENGEAAARSGQRAADELRKLEERLRGTGADARERAAADLQAEAQQVAQEQRRIAAEAERMEKGADAAGTDARRRLAADKDRLADRVDNVRREAERLAGSRGAGSGADPGGREGRPASDPARAAGELAKQRVGERMREGARQLREGSPPASGQEQQLAQALDGVVEALGGAGSAEARTLAQELDRSRAARERLDALEARIREAEGRGDQEAAKLREQYRQELARARESFGREGAPGQGGIGRREQEGPRGGTPEQQEFSRSAPGTEAFKQDRTGWESLRRDVDRALEEHDAEVSRRLARALGEDRLNGGGSERIPEHYRRLVAKYYESLAKVKR